MWMTLFTYKVLSVQGGVKYQGTGPVMTNSIFMISEKLDHHPFFGTRVLTQIQLFYIYTTPIPPIFIPHLPEF